MEPQTEREILMQLSGEVKYLTSTIKEFGESLKELEANKIVAIENQVRELTMWKAQFAAGWKVLVVITTIIGGAIGYLLKYISHL